MGSGRAAHWAPLTVVLAAAACTPCAAQARVLRVGTFRGIAGRYHAIQAAVDDARPGDWILVGPGDYHERADFRHRPVRGDAGGAVLITTPRLRLRGMDRNRVVVDGTRAGAARCSDRRADQDLGPRAGGARLGRNGVEVWKADGVSVQNLTACNFLEGDGGGGNQIWFNGGDGSGRIGMGRYLGSYLNATSTFYATGAPAAAYGIFVSNSRGPGLIDRTYASNMNDSDYYVGACPDCNAVIDHAHAQYSALGYSGTNSGGHLVLRRSEWDHNKSGITTNSQNNDDAPSPQDGRCPGTQRSCTVFRDNDVHDNNNPNVPQAGTAELSVIGSGITVSGGRFDTLRGNRIHDNGSWGVLLLPFPDDDTPPPVAHCQGGTPGVLGFRCYYDDWGNRVLDNRFSRNGFFGNPSNGDVGDVSGEHTPGNCFAGNTDPGGFTSDPADVQLTHADCSAPNAGNAVSSTLGSQVLCATELLAPCPSAPGFRYPRATRVVMPRLRPQATMRDPCRGVPANPWCPARRARFTG